MLCNYSITSAHGIEFFENFRIGIASISIIITLFLALIRLLEQASILSFLKSYLILILLKALHRGFKFNPK